MRLQPTQMPSVAHGPSSRRPITAARPPASPACGSSIPAAEQLQQRSLMGLVLSVAGAACGIGGNGIRRVFITTTGAFRLANVTVAGGQLAFSLNNKVTADILCRLPPYRQRPSPKMPRAANRTVLSGILTRILQSTSDSELITMCIITSP